MSLDPNGLRRRSPNPNSPIPYSPALLSPYIPHLNDRWLEASPDQGRSRYLSEGQTPTIRLVQPTEASGSTYYAPQPLRTRSDDQHVRASTIASSVSSLRRHGTDPKSYPSTGRYRHQDPPDRYEEPDEKPVPPLPLNIRREERESMRRPPSVMSSIDGRSIDSRSTNPYSASTRYTASPSASSTPRTTTRTMLTSLKSLHNPFTAFKSRSSRPASPTLSVRSGKSHTSFKSSSSRSSTSTLPIPFYATSFWRAYSGGSSTSVDSALMEKMRGSGGVSEKVTDKFPLRQDEGVKERWTGFKVVLLFSVLMVCQCFPVCSIGGSAEGLRYSDMALRDCSGHCPYCFAVRLDIRSRSWLVDTDVQYATIVM